MLTTYTLHRLITEVFSLYFWEIINYSDSPHCATLSLHFCRLTLLARDLFECHIEAASDVKLSFTIITAEYRNALH
jgi:hypothetical protein